MSAHAGVVLLHDAAAAAEHERAVQRLLGEKLGKLLACPFLGPYDPQRHKGAGYYFLPDDTLIGEVSGISDANDLFGGVVPYPFLATKAITHPLPEQPRHRPPGWSPDFARQAGQVVLDGYTVFDLEDARRAALRLLEQGPLRLKPVLGKAGRGQQVIRNEAELDAALQRQDAAAVRDGGLVLEEDLQQPHTYSVGQVSVAGTTLSYHGSQQLTRDNQGNQVYGGSSLTLVRGDYLALLALELDDATRLAIQQARIYELAAFAAYPALLASRRNYDVACGLDSRGRQRCGVLEQSWRLGGASAAELFALEAFIARPALQRLCASTHEHYGEVAAPPGAICLYQGEDPELGLLRKYVRVEQP